MERPQLLFAQHRVQIRRIPYTSYSPQPTDTDPTDTTTLPLSQTIYYTLPLTVHLLTGTALYPPLTYEQNPRYNLGRSS